MNKIYLIFPLFLLLFACNKDDSSELKEGLKPVYISKEEAKIISSQSVGTITKGSKIYIKNEFVFIVEQSLGVHIINNSNPNNPVGLRFLSIPGITDVAVRNEILYANNVDDLVAIDISDIVNTQVTKRIENVYRPESEYFPASYSGYFECVDESQGVVIDWEDAMLENPKCRRI